jgi:hypothetical protein
VAADTKPAALAHVAGPDFQGGGKDLFGSSFDGEQVNCVYAAPTGRHLTMQVKFNLNVNPPAVGVGTDQMRDWGGQIAQSVRPALLAARHVSTEPNHRRTLANGASNSAQQVCGR